jgi:queuine tRNA-ribosyltransferase accessory subunit
MVEAVGSGADLISTNYPGVLTVAGLAISWQLDTSDDGDLAGKEAGDGKVDRPRKRVRQSASDNAVGEDTAAASPDLLDQTTSFSPLNLFDKAYQRDKRPLLEGCGCHACRHHTRAYIHHLMVAHELLAEVLIYTHNQYQTLRLFEVIRQRTLDGDFDRWSTWLLDRI